MRLQRVQTKGTHLDFDKWDTVKQEVLGGGFKSGPGCLVTYTQTGVDITEFIRANSMQVKYTLNDTSEMFLVHKEKWSQAELDDVATRSLYFRLSILWMLPNMDKAMSLNEAIEVSKFLWSLYPLSFDSKFLVEGEWETIGYKCDGKFMTWTNPSQERADLVVENLKKLCSELEIELEEM